MDQIASKKAKNVSGHLEGQCLSLYTIDYAYTPGNNFFVRHQYNPHDHNSPLMSLLREKGTREKGTRKLLNTSSIY